MDWTDEHLADVMKCGTEAAPTGFRVTAQGAMVAALQAKMNTLASRCDVLRERSTTAEAEMLRYRAEMEELEKARETYATESGSFQRMYAASHAEVERLKEELRAVDAERNDAAFQLEAMRAPKTNSWIEADIRTVRTVLEESPSHKTPGVAGMTGAAALRLFEFARRTLAAESRLAAIREMDVERACEVMHDAYEAAAKESGWETQARSRKPWADVPEANKATMRAAVAGLKRWVLEGDAPQECGKPAGRQRCPLPAGHEGECERWPQSSVTSGNAPNPSMPSNNSGSAPQEARGHVMDCDPRTFGDMDPPIRTTIIHRSTPVCGRCARAPCSCPGGPSWPCSDTCTHDDAATPGHPERIAELSKRMLAAPDVIDSDVSPERSAARSERLNEALFRPDDDTAAEADHYNGGWRDALAIEAGDEIGRRPENDDDTFLTIENGVEGTILITRTQLESFAETKADAMRAACLEAMMNECDTLGLDPLSRKRIKAAIEGAAP